MIDEHAGLKRVLRKWFLTWVYRNIDYALYTGTENRRYFLKYGVKESQLVLCPHAVDNVRFATDSAASNPSAYRHKLGINDSDILFLFAGKLENKKGVDLLLESFANPHPGKKLLVVGNGVLEESLKKKYADSEDIKFLPFQNQSEMPSVYAMSDVFVLPSRGPGETWGLAVNEAMACSRAILVSDKCGCAIDLVVNGANGYIFKSEDSDSLKVSIEKMSGKEISCTMGQESFRIIQDWSFEKICESIERVMQ